MFEHCLFLLGYFAVVIVVAFFVLFFLFCFCVVVFFVCVSFFGAFTFGVFIFFSFLHKNLNIRWSRLHVSYQQNWLVYLKRYIQSLYLSLSKLNALAFFIIDANQSSFEPLNMLPLQSASRAIVQLNLGDKFKCTTVLSAYPMIAMYIQGMFG